MSRRTWLETTAVLAIVALLGAACSGGGRASSTSKTSVTAGVAVTPTREVVVHPLFAYASAAGHAVGGADLVVVGIRPAPDAKLSVVFREHGVEGTAALWQAAGWGAVVAATMLTGAPLRNREIDFTVTGRADGLSAGALLTIAVIALIRGDRLEPGVTMTGTVEPDGAVGPVTGIPDELDGAVKVHQTRLLIPTGERASMDDAGKPVDAVAAGRLEGVRVSEVPSIADAYRQFTGKALPRLPASTNTRLGSAAYAKLAAEVKTAVSTYDSALTDFQSLPPAVQQDLQPYEATALDEEQRAKRLASEGLQAGAFSESLNAASLMNAIAQTGQSFPILLSRGVAPFVSEIEASESIPTAVASAVAGLKKFTPQTVGDAGALIAAYDDAIDAESLSRIARELFAAKASNEQDEVAVVAEGAVYYELAGSSANAANVVLAVGEGLGGAALGPSVDWSGVASFFRRAAGANLDAFRSLFVVPEAYGAKISPTVIESELEQDDAGYALAQTGSSVVDSLPSYFGRGTISEYAELAGATSLYLRTAALLAKYASLGRVDPATFRLIGTANDATFDSVISGAEGALASSLGSLRTQRVNPTIPAADYEVASSEQNGNVNDRFDALGEFWDGYVNSRLLAYAGGFPPP